MAEAKLATIVASLQVSPDDDLVHIRNIAPKISETAPNAHRHQDDQINTRTLLFMFIIPYEIVSIWERNSAS
jgi:hypothetical protein